jgi:hypothetical protein
MASLRTMIDDFAINLDKLDGITQVIRIKKGYQLIALRVWRPQGGSNPCYRRERAVS